VLLVFRSELSDGVVTSRDTTMTFTCFVLSDMFNAISCRSTTKSIFTIGLFTNTALNFAIGGCLIGQVLMVYAPPLQSIFRTCELSLLDWFILTLLSSNVLVVDELRKVLHRRRSAPSRKSRKTKSAFVVPQEGDNNEEGFDPESGQWKEG
jgi:P-type Ca2+ transporter type 2C